MNTSQKLFSQQFKTNIEGVVFHTTLDSTFSKRSTLKELQEPIKTLHYHLEYELFFITSGKLLIQTDTERVVYTDGIICIPPNFKHYTARTNGVQRFLFSMHYNKNGELSYGKKFRAFCNQFFNDNISFLTINESIGYYLKIMSLLFYSHTAFSSQKLQSLINLLFYELYTNNVALLVDVTPSRHENYFVKIDNIINTRYAENVTLETLSKELSLSAKQVSRIIRAHYQKSLSTLLNDKKMEVAAKLLMQTNKSIAEIIQILNFETENYFYPLFKKTYGCSPLQYRKNAPPEKK